MANFPILAWKLLSLYYLSVLMGFYISISQFGSSDGKYTQTCFRIKNPLNAQLLIRNVI